MGNLGQKIKVLIADDHPLDRLGLKVTFSATNDIKVADEVENGDDLLRKVLENTNNPYHLVLLDITMPGMSGGDVLKQLREENPKLPILVFSGHSQEQCAVRSIKAGASEYLTKKSPTEQLVEVVRKVARNSSRV